MVVLLALAGAGAACGSPTDCVAAPATLLGRWNYLANQTAPSAATVTGILTLEPGCPSFEGTLDGAEQDDHGNSAPVHAVVTGQVLDSASVLFDAFVGVAGRRHLGSVAHDSIRGTWVEQATGGIARSGSFVAAKELTP